MESLGGDRTAATVADLTVVARSRRLDDVTPADALGVVDRPSVCWRGPDESIVAAGATATVTADGPDRFAEVRETTTELFGSVHADGVDYRARPRLFGGFAFHDAGADAGEVWTGFSGAWFVLPAMQLIARDGATWLTVTGTGPSAAAAADRALVEWTDRLRSAPAGLSDPPGIVRRRRTPSRAVWHEQVRDAVAEIEAGRLRKVVLAQSLTVDLSVPLSIPDALARLDETYPDCYRFAVAPPDAAGTFFGATPERLVGVRGRTVETEALAGSTGRGDTTAEDEWLSRQLRTSEKDIHEHDLVVETIRNQLRPFASTVAAGDRTIRRLATVQHLRTPIRADLMTDEHVLSLVEALHPTPAVGGLPPDVALRTIREAEGFDRGWYAAPVGWLDAAGDGTFAVGIRSALARDASASLFAGAGIVADSDPDREWDEVQLKYRPMLDGLG